MGNTSGTSKFENTVATADLQLIGKSTSIRWGELLEMRNGKSTQIIFMQERYIGDRETFKKSVEKCVKSSAFVHPNIVSIYGCAGDETPDKFTNMYKLCIFFEQITSSLKADLRNRLNASVSPNLKASQFTIPNSHYFKESEFLNLISQFIDGLQFFQNNNIYIGDITPDVCFLSSDRSIKLLDKNLIYGGHSSFEAAKRGSCHVFLTPLELESLKNQVEEEPYQDVWKADVFRLGMTLLECATLQKSSQLYDLKSFKIDLDLLSARLVKAKERYSPLIYDLLREMLRFEEYRRPDFIDLQADIARQKLQKEVSTPKKRNTASSVTPKKANIVIDVTPNKSNIIDATPKSQKTKNNAWKTPDSSSNVRKSVTTMGPKLFMSSSPNSQVDPTKRKLSAVVGSSQKPIQLLDLPLGPNPTHARKRSRVLPSESEIMDTGADFRVHAVPYVMEGKEIHGSPDRQENTMKIFPKRIESEHSLDDGKESCTNSKTSGGRFSDAPKPFHQFKGEQNLNLKSFEYQHTFGKVPSTRRRSSQCSNQQRPVEHDQSFEDKTSLHSQSQSRRNSALTQGKSRHRSHLSMDGSKMMMPSPARSESKTDKTEYYSAYSNSNCGSRLNISHESAHQDTSVKSHDQKNAMLPPRKSIEQLLHPQRNHQEQENESSAWKRVFNSQAEPSPVERAVLSSSTTFQQQSLIPRHGRNPGHFYQGSVDFGKLGLYQNQTNIAPSSSSAVHQKEEARFGKAPVPTPSFGSKRLFVEEPSSNAVLQQPAQNEIKRLKESFDFSRSPNKNSNCSPTKSETLMDDKDVDVDARFKMAMERSKRSAGFMQNIAVKMGGKSHSRSSSIDASSLPANMNNPMPKIEMFGANSYGITPKIN